MEKLSGNLPTDASKKAVSKVFESLNSNMTVKSYSDLGEASYQDGYIYQTANLKQCVKYINQYAAQTKSPSDSDNENCAGGYSEFTSSPWIVSDDNTAYSVTSELSQDCLTINEIDSKTKLSEALSASCAVIVVDVNGLTVGPNILEPQLSDEFNSESHLEYITGDRFYIFVGKDGVTAGPRSATPTGRIIFGAGVK